MDEKSQIVYSPKEVAGLLNVEPVTLRNYAKILEEHGYTFLKNEKNQRGYVDRDIISFRKLISFKNQADMTLERAANAVMTWINNNDTALSAPDDRALQTDSERSREEILREFEKFKEQQMAFNQELLQQLQKQQQYIQESLERRDKSLMEAVREMQETKRLTAATEEKKSWITKLFGK